jgi:hypothetical protein
MLSFLLLVLLLTHAGKVQTIPEWGNVKGLTLHEQEEFSERGEYNGLLPGTERLFHHREM